MKIKLLRDGIVKGKKSGEVVEINDITAQMIIKSGGAEAVGKSIPEQEEVQKDIVVEKPKKKKGK